MTIETLKSKIQNKTLNNTLLIFKHKDNDFLINQYIKKIGKCRNKEIIKVEQLTLKGMFDFEESNEIQVQFIDEFKPKEDLLSQTDIIIVTKKIDKTTQKYYNDFIIEFPKLEEWQIKEYIDCKLSKLSPNDRDLIYDLYKKDLFNLTNEINKLSIFDNPRNIYNQLTKEGYFDKTNKSIFDLSNAIIKKDINTIKEIYEHINDIDIEPFGLLTILYKNFKNIMNIQMSKNPTPESCGMKSNVFYAIKKYNTGIYTNEQLVKIMTFLTEIDYKIKNGEMPTNILIDYMIIFLLTS